MNSRKPFDLRARTSAFARVPHGNEAGTIKRQLFRAGTSVGANYRAALRAKSRRDFVSKLSIVEEEADECIYWLELLEEANVVPSEAISTLKREANELVAITAASKKTARRNGLSQVR